jgi:hypothetical protein
MEEAASPLQIQASLHPMIYIFLNGFGEFVGNHIQATIFQSANTLVMHAFDSSCYSFNCTKARLSPAGLLVRVGIDRDLLFSSFTALSCGAL